MKDRPELFADLAYYWKAFHELHRSRSVGMAANPITASDIEAWVNLHGVSDIDERLRYYEFISLLDAAWLTWNAKQAKQKQLHHGKAQ